MTDKKQERGNWNIPEINLKLDDGTIAGITNGLFSPRITSSRLHVTSMIY